MKNEWTVGLGVLGLWIAGCASQRAESPAPSRPPEPETSAKAVEHSGMTLADALRAAVADHPGFTPVAVGVEDDGQGKTQYDVALLSQGRVVEVYVDAETGKSTPSEEHAVREGHEAFAAKLEALLPSAKIDLSRAVEIAVARGEGARMLGAQIDVEDDRLVYSVTVLSGAEAIDVAVDPTSGDVLRTEAATLMDDDESHEMEGDPDAQDAMSEMQGESAMDYEAHHPAVVDENFDEVPVGRLPEGWKVESSGSDAEPAPWSVVDGADKGHALAPTRGGSKNASALCWTDSILFEDGSIEASMKPVSGKKQQGGGIVWRVKDKDDYYVCFADPLEGKFSLDVVENGEPRRLASADVDVSAGAWHRIRVEQDGEHIVGSLDGTKLLDSIDPMNPGEGGIGFWTRGDAITSFDELLVTSSKEGRGRDDDGDEDDDEMDGERR